MKISKKTQTFVGNSLIKHSTQCFLRQILSKALYFMKLYIFIIQTVFNNGIFSMSFASNFVRRNKNTVTLIKYLALLLLQEHQWLNMENFTLLQYFNNRKYWYFPYVKIIFMNQLWIYHRHKQMWLRAPILNHSGQLAALQIICSESGI